MSLAVAVVVSLLALVFWRQVLAVVAVALVVVLVVGCADVAGVLTIPTACARGAERCVAQG